MTYVSDRETVEAAIRADRTAPSKARRDKALIALAARADQEFADVAGYSDLTDDRRQELLGALLNAKKHFDFRERARAISKDSAAIALLNKVVQSIDLTAKFGETVLGAPPKTKDDTGKPPSAQGIKARRFLDEAGERWAQSQLKAGIKLPDGFVHYGADGFIEGFLRSARVMREIVKLAELPPPKKGIEGRAVNLQHSPMQWLAGKKLPAIYRQTFGSEFTASPQRKDSNKTSNGIKFVRAACIAMGATEAPGPLDETIKSHYRDARKGSSLGRASRK
jgi:hypothetical protein